jgi:hypothetical protein
MPQSNYRVLGRLEKRELWNTINHHNRQIQGICLVQKLVRWIRKALDYLIG